MACNEIQLWSFIGLVGAFLDLSIAFLLLCASTLAYLVSKFLGLFGLYLPCPCNGLFGDPNGGKCWQKVMVDSPSQKISSVQFSVRSKFPFDTIWDKNLKSHVNLKNHEHEFARLDDEASCSLFQERTSERSVGSGVAYARDVKEDKFDVKGKGVWNQKVRQALRRRRKGATDNGRFSSVPSFDTSQSDAQALPHSPASVNKLVNESKEDTMIADSSGDGRDSLMDTGLLGKGSLGSESNEPTKEEKLAEKDDTCADDLKFKTQEELYDGNDEKHTIRVLEHALEEEQAALSALYLELEKERSAAATAADEAMAMILRLQEEKASIEMEARQYQRMIEEKSAYDYEEMNILKEILLRREKEIHFLENEVETYRQMIFESEQLDSDAQSSHGKRISSLLYAGEDPVLMLQKINESICETENVENGKKFSEYEVTSTESHDRTLAFGKELPIPELVEVNSSTQGCIPRDPSIDKYYQSNGEKFEEMEPLSWKRSPFPQERDVKNLEMHTEFNLPTTEGYTLNERTVATIGEVQEQGNVISTSQGSPKAIQACNVTKNISCDDSEKDGKDSSNTISIPFVHDVHVVDDKLNICDEDRGNGSEKLSENVSLDIPKSCDSPVMSRLQTEQYISRSCSELNSGLPPRGSFQRKPLVSELRRNSMSAVDYERFKIDNEVGWLRERLRTIQEGREKLNISMEHREKENFQLQLLENIVTQLRELRQLTEPGNAVRQVSLPPPSCKIMSKKRRWRSVSLEVHRST